MYNKLFTKILDSSIWLEPTTTRLTWLTLIAAMDEDGFAQFASVPNLAHRARVSIEEAQEAVTALEAPDPHSSDPDNEGRRIERVPGGWMILNARKYHDLVTRVVSKEQTRLRVAKYREKKAGNAPVTASNGKVTQSDTDTTTHSDSKSDTKTEGASRTKKPEASGYSVPACFEKIEGFTAALAGWIEVRTKKRNPPTGLAIQLLINRLSEHPERAVAALNAAIEGGWTTAKWDWLDNYERKNGRHEKPPVETYRVNQDKVPVWTPSEDVE